MRAKTFQTTKRHYLEALTGVVTLPEAAVIWGIPVSTLKRWCNEGIITATKPTIGRVWLISTDSMLDWCGAPKVDGSVKDLLYNR